MTSTCVQCGEALAKAGGFCGKCGARQPDPIEDADAVARYRAVVERFASDGTLDAGERLQLEVLRRRLGVSDDTHRDLLAELEARAPRVAGSLRIYVDVATIRHFEVAARCLVRLRVENTGELALERVELHCQVAGEPPPPPAETASTVLPGANEVVTLWLIPRVAGHQELRGVVAATDVLGARTTYAMGKIQFRVASAAEAARAHVVNIDQRNARVVDNSRSSFGADTRKTAPLISDAEGEWSPVPVEVIAAEEAGRLAPALAAVAAPASARGDGKYGGRRLVGRSPQFALYQCALPDGRPGMVKVAASTADNFALDREAYVLRLMAEEAVRRDRENPDRPFNYQYFFPELVDTFLDEGAGGVRTNVLAFPPEIERLGQLRPAAALSEGSRTRVDPRSSAWILGKTLKVLAFAHHLGIANGRVEAGNVLCETERHGILLFDWTQARIHDDGAVSPDAARAEVSQAARMTLELLGADGASGALPASDQLPDRRYEELLRALASGATSDAAAAHRDFYELLGAIWPRKFHPFTTHRREG